MQCWQTTPFDHQDNRKPFQVDQPLDFSVKSPGSFGGSERDFCSPHRQEHSTSRSSKSRGSAGSLITKDEQYWVRREKNNAAAKRSRDARRQKEEQTKFENQILREENAKLQNTVRSLQKHIEVCPLGRKVGDYNER